MEEVFEVTGRNPKLDLAVELEKHALGDDYFIERKLYPNVDFYSGLIYEALNLPPDMFTVMFAIPRTSAGSPSGWRWSRTRRRRSPGRPIYTGSREQSYVPIDKREKKSEKPTAETNLIDPARNETRLDPEDGHEPLLVLGLDLGDDLDVLLDPEPRSFVASSSSIWNRPDELFIAISPPRPSRHRARS